MMLKRPDGERKTHEPDGYQLEPSAIQEIERALRQVGEDGEVRLVVFDGRLRSIQIVESEGLAGGGAKDSPP